jgi:phage terminase large subunit-like protein
MSEAESANSWTDADERELLRLLLLEQQLTSQNKYLTYYPEAGPLRRELYKKHLEFFAAGKEYRERCFLAANRVGKTEGVGAYELTLHATGKYPSWWIGRRFEGPISAWASGDTSKTTREIIQFKLLGPVAEYGTGMLPYEDIVRTTAKPGVPDAIETIYVRHISGGRSEIGLKSYDQKREAFQGTTKHVIWLDEEPSLDIYTECLLRTMTTDGMIICTFTPLLGMSDVVRYFLDIKATE